MNTDINFQTFAMLGPWEIFGILAVALILFGAKRLPELAKGMGQGLKEFKKATREVTSDLQQAIEDEPKRTYTPPVQKPAEPAPVQKAPQAGAQASASDAPEKKA